MAKDNLTIMQISPIWYPVRKDIKQGSIERVVSYLDEEYIRQGHNSIVVASGDSEVSGELFAPVNHSTSRFGVKHHHEQERKCALSTLERISKGDIDVFHDQLLDNLTFRDEYLKYDIQTPSLVTLHGDNVSVPRRDERIDLLKKLGKRFYFSAISKSQGRAMENAGLEVDDIIYHGIPVEDFDFREEKQDYLLWLGRISDIKGADLAVKLAQESGLPLIMAGKIYPDAEGFYDREIKPYLTYELREPKNPKFSEENEAERNRFLRSLDEGDRILNDGEMIYIGQVNNQQKTILYRNARTFLMPDRWNEPFGLVMIEAMACGTPVLGTDKGAIGEVVEHGKTGLVLPFEDESQLIKDMIYSLDNVSKISPYDCRNRVEGNFTIQKEAGNYINLFRRIKNDTL